jgi:hypothetical protein
VIDSICVMPDEDLSGFGRKLFVLCVSYDHHFISFYSECFFVGIFALLLLSVGVLLVWLVLHLANKGEKRRGRRAAGWPPGHLLIGNRERW